jgi:hypothetical protein
MAALTASNNLVGSEDESKFKYIPVAASTTIYQGGIVVRDAITGDLKNAASLLQGHLCCVGILSGGCVKGTRVVSTTDADNASGAAQAITAEVQSGKITLENGSSIDALAAADAGLPCYAIDTRSVSKHSLNGNRALAGIFLGLNDSGRCIVRMDGEKRINGRTITVPANASLATKQFTLVKLVNDSGLSEAASATAGTDNIDGILLNAPASGDPALIMVDGEAPLVFGSTECVAGDSLTATTAGAGIPAAASLNGITLGQTVITGDGAGNLGTANGAFEDQNGAVGAGAVDTACALKADVDARLVSIGNNVQELYAQLVLIKADVIALHAKLLPTVACVALETGTSDTKMVRVAPRNTTV